MNHADHLELPPEVQEALDAVKHEGDVPSAETLKGLEQAIIAKRTEAISARKESGIEAVWLAAEEAYLGMDDANRSSFANAKWSKPTSLQGPVTTNQTKNGNGESTAFVRITSRYVDAGAAKLGEILLPIGDKAFAFSPTPVPEAVNGLENNAQAVHEGVPLERDATPADGVAPAAPGQPAPGVPITVKDLAQEKIDLMTKAAKRAEKRIYDWMVESQFPAEMRKVIFDMARLGVGVLKGPYVRKKVSKAMTKKGGQPALNIKVDHVPGYAWVDPWNIFPDPACGEKLRDGDYIFEYDQFSAKQLRRLKGAPGYIGSAIDAVLAVGPQGDTTQNSGKPGERKNVHRYGVWYFYGAIKREDYLAANRAAGGDEKVDGAEVYAVCTMVNDTLIRAVLNPLDSGEFPYHNVPWQRRAGHWAGVGVGEQLAMPQRAINAVTRAMFNNAGKSAGTITVVDRGSIVPADGNWVITPEKVFYKTSDATSDDVRKAFAFFEVPNHTNALMVIVEYILRLAEESTNIPLVTQGQSGSTTPETFGATQLQNNNANQLLRSVAYAVDDHLTEPVVHQSYEMLLLDDNVPDDEKGDWSIDAHGSTALIERAIQDQTIQQMGQFALNPVFGVNPKRWFAEFSKTKHLNPANFQNTPEEQAKIDSQPPPAAPAVQVAQIRSADAKAALTVEQQAQANEAHLQQIIAKLDADTKLQIANMRKEVDELRVRRDTDRDTIYVTAETERTRTEGEARNRELDLRRELAMLEYANKHELQLGEVKAKLAETQMRLQVQKELSGIAQEVDLHKHHNPSPTIPPAAEPAGKAPSGQAFAK